VEGWIRAMNELQVWAIVPNSRHAAQRNLHVVGVPIMITRRVDLNFILENPGRRRGPIDLYVSRAGAPAGAEVRVTLPAGTRWRSGDGRGIAATPAAVRPAKRGARTKPTARGTTWRVTAREGVFRRIELNPGESIPIVLGVTAPGPDSLTDAAWRVAVLARNDSTVIGGNTYVFRPEPAPAAGPPAGRKPKRPPGPPIRSGS
jgi:hypothetical protein